MGDYNFGTTGMWKTLFWLAFIGLATVVIGVVAIVLWLIFHVRWVIQ